LATDPVSLAHGSRMDHVSGGLAKGETLNIEKNRVSSDTIRLWRS
jgi:hypothetical protein